MPSPYSLNYPDFRVELLLEFIHLIGHTDKPHNLEGAIELVNPSDIDLEPELVDMNSLIRCNFIGAGRYYVSMVVLCQDRLFSYPGQREWTTPALLRGALIQCPTSRRRLLLAITPVFLAPVQLPCP